MHQTTKLLTNSIDIFRFKSIVKLSAYVFPLLKLHIFPLNAAVQWNGWPQAWSINQLIMPCIQRQTQLHRILFVTRFRTTSAPPFKKTCANAIAEGPSFRFKRIALNWPKFTKYFLQRAKLRKLGGWAGEWAERKVRAKNSLLIWSQWIQFRILTSRTKMIQISLEGKVLRTSYFPLRSQRLMSEITRLWKMYNIMGAFHRAVLLRMDAWRFFVGRITVLRINSMLRRVKRYGHNIWAHY